MSEFSDLFLVIKELIKTTRDENNNHITELKKEILLQNEELKKIQTSLKDVLCPEVIKLKENAKNLNILMKDHKSCWEGDHSPKILKKEIDELSDFIHSNKCPKWFLLFAKFIKKISGLD